MRNNFDWHHRHNLTQRTNSSMNRLQTLPSASSEFALHADPDRWVDDHGDCLHGYALIRVRKQEVAEDLVQETLLAAMRQVDKFRGRSSERSWLCGILKRSGTISESLAG